MPACHPKAEKLRIWQDNLKPKRENRMLTHQMELELREFLEIKVSSDRLLHAISCKRYLG